MSKKVFNFTVSRFMTTHSELLQVPISNLPLSGKLKTLLSSKGYQTLRHLLQQTVSHLRTKDGLTLHDELELFELVKENGLMDYWKEM